MYSIYLFIYELGKAALLASAASVVSVSSDIGGSARLPALFCGVFGHKPTPGNFIRFFKDL